MVEVDYDVLLPVANYDEEASFLLLRDVSQDQVSELSQPYLGAITDESRNTGVTVVA